MAYVQALDLTSNIIERVDDCPHTLPANLRTLVMPLRLCPSSSIYSPTQTPFDIVRIVHTSDWQYLGQNRISQIHTAKHLAALSNLTEVLRVAVIPACHPCLPLAFRNSVGAGRV